MDDTCVVVRPDLGDGVLDRNTGKLVELPAITIYDATHTGYLDRPLGAMCKIKPASNPHPNDRQIGSQPNPQRFFTLGLPWDAPEVLEGDIATILTSRRDPQLVNDRYIAREILHTTMLVQRRVIVERLP